MTAEEIDRQLETRVEKFESIDEQLKKVDQRFDRMDATIDLLTREVRGMRDWMELNVVSFAPETGRRLEDIVAGAFCHGLERMDIRPEHVHLRQTLVDREGAVFHRCKNKEVNIIDLDDQIIVFDVNSAAKHDDIEDLADETVLVALVHPGKKVEGILVMLGAESEQRKMCSKKGLRLIP